MPKTMLIDAGHREETRVAVLQGGKVEDFDFEYASRKPLRGNIYLARVTRVEPSLQAAFVEYGGNRHGFLAFGEIHSDYYQIPVADREVLRKAEALEVELARKLAELSQDDDDDTLDPDEDDLGADRDRGSVEAADDTADSADDTSDGNVQEADDDADAETAAAADLPADFDPGSAEQMSGDWHGADADLIKTVQDVADDGVVAPDAGDESAKPDEEEEEEDRKIDDDGATSSTDEVAAKDEAETEDHAEDHDDEDVVAWSSEDDTAEDAADDEAEDEGLGDDAASIDADTLETVAEADEDESDDDDGAEDEDVAPSGDAAAAKAAQAEINKLREEYENAKRERNRLLRAYKIQEVIKRRQIMLVQVVKEERGNKGAALTTYLSLAGRYCVLMPNTARGGGISRKITSQSDRKRLKKAMAGLDIAQNMGLIVRTAGAKRTKTEIKRDYDYLSRLWGTIRDKTLDSVAPTLIYEEASLMKRAIRDLYDKDTDKVIVQGEAGYREAKDFMKMLMPSHAKHVQQYKGDVPIFLKHKVEQQLDEMYQPVVKLKSGGYLVIQQTEALVSIDVNSGKSTKERNVEATALKTNSEAAVEVARQCRLRDLAGLIVVDFIDMEENRNNRAVERKFKEAMKNDRARTQIGGISTFGLLEMSRQRRRSGIVDGTTQVCPVCEGAGHIRSHEMAGMRILRAAEGQAAIGKVGVISVKTSIEVALYILNTKREWLQRAEELYGVRITIVADSGKFGDQYEVTGSGSPSESLSLRDAVGDEGPTSDFEAPELDSDDSDASDNDNAAPSEDDSSEDKPKKRRRRRRRRGEGRSDDDQQASENQDSEAEESADAEASTGDSSEASDDSDGDGESKRRRRRGRRGGRRNRRNKSGEGEATGTEGEANADAGPESTDANTASATEDEKHGGAEPAAATSSEEATESVASAPNTEDMPATDEKEATPEAAAASVVDLDEQRADADADAQPSSPAPASEEADPAKPRRGGWWQRAFNKN